MIPLELVDPAAFAEGLESILRDSNESIDANKDEILRLSDQISKTQEEMDKTTATLSGLVDDFNYFSEFSKYAQALSEMLFEKAGRISPSIFD